MKLKKLFAGIVAVAMMATMAAPVFADAPTSGSTVEVMNNGTVSIGLTYTGSTGWTTDSIGLDVGDGKAYAMTNTSLDATAQQTEKNRTISDASDKTVDENATTKELKIQLPAYQKTGTYYYHVKQKASTVNGMEHDTKELVLMVHVINNNEDDLSDTLLKCKVAVLDADPLQTGTKPTKLSSLTNTYTSASYEVKKVVKGSLGDRDQTFSFRVTFTKAEGKAVSGKIMMTLPGQRAVELNPTWENDKTYTTTVFTMKHGETATFANVPKDVTVAVEEMNGNTPIADNTTFTVNGNEYRVGYANASVKIADANAVTATVTNESTIHPNTGVILDNAPYIALLTIVAAGAVVMIMKKRRTEED